MYRRFEGIVLAGEGLEDASLATRVGASLMAGKFQCGAALSQTPAGSQICCRVWKPRGRRRVPKSGAALAQTGSRYGTSTLFILAPLPGAAPGLNV